MATNAPQGDSYWKLIGKFPLISIKSSAQLAAAQEVVDRLLAKNNRDNGEEAYVDALSDLIFAFEEAHEPIEPPSDADLLRHFLDAKSIAQARLSRDTGLSKSSISEVLAGRKPLSRRMIRTLAEYFKVDIGVLAANL
jgi:HTH-type transcriptional regulator/antitoxin HigA